MGFALLIIILVTLGAAVGLMSGVDWNQYAAYRPGVFAVAGAVAGAIVAGMLIWMRTVRQPHVVDQITLSVPLFAGVRITLSDADRRAGWRIFVETSTRVSTQALQDSDGSLAEAMASLHALFEAVRAELKLLPPSLTAGERKNVNVDTVETYSLRLLNECLRPFLARWHPQLSDWLKLGKSENDWPHRPACRADLEATRGNVLAYTWGFGEMLRISRLESLLPPLPVRSENVPVEGADSGLAEKPNRRNASATVEAMPE
jgi:hypothetical protein